jgi:hypothetical protein
VAATAVIVIASNAVNQIRCLAHLLLAAINGSNRMGRKMRPEAAPGRVSVKTTVIW